MRLPQMRLVRKFRQVTRHSGAASLPSAKAIRCDEMPRPCVCSIPKFVSFKVDLSKNTHLFARNQRLGAFGFPSSSSKKYKISCKTTR